MNEGRVDGGVMIEGPFKKQVEEKNGPYHHLVNDVVYNEFAVIKTWPLLIKKSRNLRMHMTKRSNNCKKKKKRMS